MIELIKELVSNLINPKDKSSKKTNLKYELQVKFEKSLYLKEYLRTKAWLEFDKPRIYNSLENGMLSLIRNGLEMEEKQLKMIIADMRANIYKIEDMRNAIEQGEEAGAKLERMK